MAVIECHSNHSRASLERTFGKVYWRIEAIFQAILLKMHLYCTDLTSILLLFYHFQTIC